MFSQLPKKLLEEASVVSQGTIRKLGAEFTTWKPRKYIIRSNATFSYYDETSGKLKGTLSAAVVMLQQGNQSNIIQSGSINRANGVSININFVENNKIIAVVFDSFQEFETFCDGISQVCSLSNVQVSLIMYALHRNSCCCITFQCAYCTAMKCTYCIKRIYCSSGELITYLITESISNAYTIHRNSKKRFV
jgi:hypothetical protein